MHSIDSLLKLGGSRLMLSLDEVSRFDSSAAAFAGLSCSHPCGLNRASPCLWCQLRAFDAELTRNFMRRPADYLPPFEEALREV